MSVMSLLAILLSIQVAISDLYARRVSNRWLLAALAIAGAWLLGRWVLAGAGFPGTHLLGLGLGLAVLLPFYAIGWMGAGDVKFFAVLGFLLGAPALWPVWLIASLLAGVHAVCVLLGRRLQIALPARALMLREAAQGPLQRHPAWRQALLARQGRHGIPYAAYLAAGAVVSVLAPLGGTA